MKHSEIRKFLIISLSLTDLWDLCFENNKIILKVMKFQVIVYNI